MLSVVTYYTLELSGIKYVVGEKTPTGSIVRLPLAQVRPLRENEMSEPLPINATFEPGTGRVSLTSPVAGSEQSLTPQLAAKGFERDLADQYEME